MGEAIAGLVKGFLEGPVATLLMLMGFFVITFSILLKVDDGDGKKIKIVGRTSAYWPGLIVGVLLFGSGLFYQSIIAAQTPPTPTPTATLTPEPSITASATVQPSATVSETPVLMASATSFVFATETPVPTVTITHTPSPTQALTVKEHGCIFASTWQVDSFGAINLPDNLDNKGCWSLDGIGITADKFSILHVDRTAKKLPLTAGIYTPVGSRSIVEFKVFVESFYIINPETPATINFAIAPAGDPVNNSNSARFKLSVDTTVKSPYIYFMLADLGEANGSKVLTQHYEYGYGYAIRMELTGAVIRVFINGKQMDKELSVPFGQKVFVISYNLPTLADADIEITDIQVDGVDK